MEEYIITQGYFDANEALLTEFDFPVGTIVTQDEAGHLEKVAARGEKDPVNPPPVSPPILP